MIKESKLSERYVQEDSTGDLRFEYDTMNGEFYGCSIFKVGGGTIRLDQEQFEMMALWCSDVQKEIK